MCFYAKCWSTGKWHTHKNKWPFRSIEKIVTCSASAAVEWCMPSSYYLWMGACCPGKRATDCFANDGVNTERGIQFEKQSLLRFFCCRSFSVYVSLLLYTIRELSSSCCCVPIVWTTTNATSFVISLSRHFNSISLCISKRIHARRFSMKCHIHATCSVRSIQQFNIWAIPFCGFHLILSCFIRFILSLSFPRSIFPGIFFVSSVFSAFGFIAPLNRVAFGKRREQIEKKNWTRLCLWVCGTRRRKRKQRKGETKCHGKTFNRPNDNKIRISVVHW